MEGIEYRVSLLNEYPVIVISNTEKRELRENREIVDGIPLDYINVKPTNEPIWKAIVKDVLGSKKVLELQKNNEQMGTVFFFKPTGKVISMLFCQGRHEAEPNRNS